MNKFIVVAIIVLFLETCFSGVLYNFAYQFMIEKKVPEQHARLMAFVLEEEAKSIPLSIDPLFMLAFGMCETGFVNAFGDKGKAVGYFQLHENAVIYVANFYDDVRQFKKNNRIHAELIKYPDWQLKIAYRYIYLTLKNVYNWDLIQAIAAYNGRKDRYNQYTVKFFKNYSDIVQMYTTYLSNLSNLTTLPTYGNKKK